MAQKTVKKASTTTEVILGRASNNLNKSLAEFETAMTSMKELATKSETLSAEIAQKEERILELETEYAEKKRAAEVSFELEFKANKEEVIEDHLTEFGLVMITKTQYDTLTKELSDLKANYDTEVKKQVAIVTSSLNKDHEGATKLKDAQYSAEKASMTAQLDTLKDKITFLTEQNEEWKEQLSAERQASTERAKASQIGNLNISGAGK